MHAGMVSAITTIQPCVCQQVIPGSLQENQKGNHTLGANIPSQNMQLLCYSPGSSGTRSTKVQLLP
jgi:hypothetical protein